MLELLVSELGKADDNDWKVVFGHYPCHSGGHYGGFSSIQEQVLPIMKGFNVDFYLTGHDHNQQHWTERSFEDAFWIRNSDETCRKVHGTIRKSCCTKRKPR